MKLILRKSPANVKYPVRLPVSPKTLCDSQELPLGLYGPILRYMNAQRCYVKESNVFKGKYFQMWYYPPTSFPALFRKTKPSITIKFTPNSSFLNTSSPYLKSVYTNRKSAVPADYAVWRRKLRIELRKTFYDRWCELGGNIAANDEAMSQAFVNYPGMNTEKGVAKDGFYLFNVWKYPITGEMSDFKTEVKKSVEVVANLDWDKFLKKRASKSSKSTRKESWVDQLNNKINIYTINKLLKENGSIIQIEKLNKHNNPK